MSSSFEDDLLNDFRDNEEDEDSSLEEEGDDVIMDDDDKEEEIEVENFDIPKKPLKLDLNHQELLTKLSNGVIETNELLEKCNSALSKLSAEILVWNRRACRLYQQIFPELEKLVPDPVEYANVLLAYGESDDADLTKILNSATVMVVKVQKSAHANSIRSLKDKTELLHALEACRNILSLEEDRKLILNYVENAMKTFAPNLYDLVGSRTAALLVGIAGSLVQLSKIPCNDIKVLGRKKAMRADTGIAHGQNAVLYRHAGVLAQCPLVMNAPVHLKQKTLRVLAGRVALAARVDEAKRDFKSGKLWKEEIEKKIDLWQQPGPGKSKKALPVPDAQRPKKRGGRRARKMKEKLGLTNMRALASREQFGEGSNDVEYSVSAMGEDLGMLTKSANGRVRAVQAKDTQRLGEKAAKKLRAINAGSSGKGQISGFSSLAFTPVQGMELAPSVINPSVTSSSSSSLVAKQPDRKKPMVPAFSRN